MEHKRRVYTADVCLGRPTRQKQLTGLTLYPYPEKLFGMGHVSAAVLHHPHSSSQICKQMLRWEVVLKVFI